MGIFRQLHKSAFWSQLLLGMVAILSLPAAEAVPNTAQSNAIQQSYNLSELVATQQVESEQAHFFSPTSNHSTGSTTGQNLQNVCKNLPVVCGCTTANSGRANHLNAFR